MIMPSKACTKCGIERPINKFKSGHAQCRMCYNATQREWHEQRIGQGLCRCGSPAKPGRTFCEACLARQKVSRGTSCVVCNHRPKRPGSARCEECFQKQYARQEERRKAGRCAYCKAGDPSLPGSTRCETCLFKAKAMTHLGSSARWTVLRDIWDRQGGRCPYTGAALRLVDADIDHVSPRADGENNDPSNLQFVLRAANEMKGAHSEEQFLRLVEDIFRHCVLTGKLAPLE